MKGIVSRDSVSSVTIGGEFRTKPSTAYGFYKHGFVKSRIKKIQHSEQGRTVNILWLLLDFTLL
jgi:hypothetical protein